MKNGPAGTSGQAAWIALALLLCLALRVQQLAVPVVVTLGGGYNREIERSVAAHVAVYENLIEELADR